MKSRTFLQMFLWIGLVLAVILAIRGDLLRREVTSVFAFDSIYFELLEPESISYFYKIRPAKDFGAVMNHSFPNIELVLANPLKGCSMPENAAMIRGSVALLERGECSFLSKVIQAEASGAVAAIIMDHKEDNYQVMVDMIHDETGRATDIPAFFMLGKDGFMIRRTLTQLGLQSALINIPLNVSGQPINSLRQPPWSLW